MNKLKIFGVAIFLLSCSRDIYHTAPHPDEGDKIGVKNAGIQIDMDYFNTLDSLGQDRYLDSLERKAILNEYKRQVDSIMNDTLIYKKS